ncbi:hypothetical protein C8T65DRAFT_735466 [Cerioporus squamosus]|nr:hypothetical protein C8T65DRAFT_735466 [Cerioporus squamosus]
MNTIESGPGILAFEEAVATSEARIKWIDSYAQAYPHAALDRSQAQVQRAQAIAESRLLGHVVVPLPLDFGVGSERCTEDWAIVEIAKSKIDLTNFVGNAIDLGTRMPADEFKEKEDGTVPVETRRRSNDVEECITVLKRGAASGLTIGRANNVRSVSRLYFAPPNTKLSFEWAIRPLTRASGPFSAAGDSGAVVADGSRRIGGILTGGAGNETAFDVAYATPIDFLLRRI